MPLALAYGVKSICLFWRYLEQFSRVPCSRSVCLESKGSGKEYFMNSGFTMRWLVQAGLGIMLVILLTIHLIVNHWAAPHGLLTYGDVVRYYDIPGIAWMEAAFL